MTPQINGNKTKKANKKDIEKHKKSAAIDITAQYKYKKGVFYNKSPCLDLIRHKVSCVTPM